MKKIIYFIIICVISILFVGCSTKMTEEFLDYNIDYTDAKSFESALNNEDDVVDKYVQFSVNEYAPDSILGINCHAGEHLNFIFESELDVESGDVIVVRITKEPSKIFLLGSWKVPCEFIELVSKTIEKENLNEKKQKNDQVVIKKETISVPDDWTNLLEKHYEEVEYKFKEAGFTNIECVAHEIDYNENNVFEGSVINIAIGENGENCTFEKDEQFEKDVKIRIDYRVKPQKNQVQESSQTETSNNINQQENTITNEKTPVVQETPSENVIVPTQPETQGNLVWVSTNGGTKYHSRPGCSNMKNPMQVSKETAEANGYTPCGRCY